MSLAGVLMAANLLSHPPPGTIRQQHPWHGDPGVFPRPAGRVTRLAWQAVMSGKPMSNSHMRVAPDSTRAPDLTGVKNLQARRALVPRPGPSPNSYTTLISEEPSITGLGTLRNHVIDEA
jgi:hypothetical protein